MAYTLWECLDKEEQQIIRAIMPHGWKPLYNPPLESLKEIEVIMQQPAQGELAKILSGKPIK